MTDNFRGKEGKCLTASVHFIGRAAILLSRDAVRRCMMRFLFFVLLLTFSLFLQGAASSAVEKKSPSEQEFCRVDKNSDREITFEEFQACEFYKLGHVRALPYSAPQDLGRKEDRTLSDDKLKADLFNEADTNRNRLIDRKEWEDFYKSISEQGRKVE